MEKLKIAEQEREQLARHNVLLERAIIARDRVSADFGEAKAADLEEAKVCHCCPSTPPYELSSASTLCCCIL